MPIRTATASITGDTQVLINDSAVGDTQTLFVWGVSFNTSSEPLVTVSVQEHSGSTSYMKFGASRNAGFQWQGSSPIAFTRGKGIQVTNAASAALATQLSTTISVVTVFYQIV
tara:strand:+ start:1614 stop:1952 length:339 start_codon:yes stop_codon:yes gene_type:complete